MIAGGRRCWLANVGGLVDLAAGIGNLFESVVVHGAVGICAGATVGGAGSVPVYLRERCQPFYVTLLHVVLSLIV